MLKVDRAFEAYLDKMDSITILLPRTYHSGVSHFFFLKRGNEQWELQIMNKVYLAHFIKYECKVKTFIEIGELYTIADERGSETDLQIGAVIRTKEFDDAYFYTGDDLGVTYKKEHSTFKVWAPSAAKVKVRLYEKNLSHQEFEMERMQNGVWSCTILQDCEGMLYTFLVCVNLVWREAVDPYAKSVSVNGEYGVVIDFSKVKAASHALPPRLSNFTDAVIYEAHIRDLTIDQSSGVCMKGKYLGLTEEHTAASDGMVTGLAYLKNLGITHLELLPFNDFAGVDELDPSKLYNWGYNPLHFNAPEGSYSTDPEDPYTRIRELKNMIQALHINGIHVVMDVVYNHVYIRELSSFEKIVPGYYFRHDANGMPSNGTGVGNDIASERRMVRKFIIDSVLYWIREYGIDGLRFDLMGILDYETMNAIRRAVDEIDTSILIIGEGWELNTPLPVDQKASLLNAAKMPRIAHFNDRFRDIIKGNTFHVYDKGYAFGNYAYHEEVKRLLAGSIPLKMQESSLFLEPNQTVNYVESHDNYTMWDKICISNKEETDEMRRRRHLLATSMVLLAQGIPFLHSGQEFYRTKNGIENSYNAPDDVNRLDWQRMRQYVQTVEYVKGLIALRKSHGAFRLPSAALIQKHMRFIDCNNIMMCELNNIGEFGVWNKLVVLFNINIQQQQVFLPEKGEWQILANHEKAAAEAFSSIEGNTMLAMPVSSYVLGKL
ncbi:type I pullulanase [Bacillus sp. 165]|uniref:type I pullulanase n=1 Tax=Bacillus sp. 165 TaxID=1529117 RepID=UPI001ADAF1C3|nr:type I pullulanase [Bacillus sp. 165]MBO9130879.1 type I pullulanase [Bacillus sp. 165]